MSEFLQSQLWNVISNVIAVAGVFLAILFYILGRRFRRLSYDIKSFDLLSNSIASIPGFSASFQGNEIKDLTATKILIWNSGTEVISKGDLAKTDPLSIILPNSSTILFARVSFSSCPTNQASANINNIPNIVHIAFDYLAKGQGMIISLLHTGRSKQDIVIGGIIKGGQGPMSYKKSWDSVGLGMFLMLFWLMLLIFCMQFYTKSLIAIIAVLAVGIAINVYLEKLRHKRAGGKLDEVFTGRFVFSESTEQEEKREN